MHARLALLFGSAVLLLGLARCGSQGKRAETPAPVASQVTPDAHAEGGAGGAAHDEPREEPRRPDPRLVQKALDRTGAESSTPAPHGLRFELVEVGPQAAWAMAVVNRGTETMKVEFDPRLLVLEVEPPPDPKAKRPAKPKPRVCRLPDELRSARNEERFALVLAPGQGMVEAFDPRLYCLPEGGESPFVAGARVSARFGFAPKTKTVWRKGKREEELLPQTAPWVAVVAPVEAGEADGGVDAGSEADAARERATPETGVKELVATPFELGSDYTAAPKPPPASLVLDLVRGSDAASEVAVTVTLALTNRGKEMQRVYFRRELVSFEVSGPDGVVVCDPQPDERAPDRLAFSAMNPGRTLTVTSRLVELCPDDTFARPGLYLVSAVFDATAEGKDFGLDAFVGRVVAERSVVVRVRKGSLPFPGSRTLEEVRVGGSP